MIIITASYRKWFYNLECFKHKRTEYVDVVLSLGSCYSRPTNLMHISNITVPFSLSILFASFEILPALCTFPNILDISTYVRNMAHVIQFS